MSLGKGESRRVSFLLWAGLDGGWGRIGKRRAGTMSFCRADCSRSRDTPLKTARKLCILWVRRAGERLGLRCELRNYLNTHSFVPA